MYFRKKTSGGRAYLQIVESRRQGAQVRQQVIATLGRVEELRESGQLERLLRSGARFAAKAIVVDAVADGAVTASAARRIGPALVFERLWEETGCRAVIADLQAQLFRAMQAGDLKTAQGINDRIYPLAKVFYADPWADMHNRMKEALVLLGKLPRAVVRPPLVKIERAEIERIREALGLQENPTSRG